MTLFNVLQVYIIPLININKMFLLGFWLNLISGKAMFLSVIVCGIAQVGWNSILKHWFKLNIISNSVEVKADRATQLWKKDNIKLSSDTSKVENHSSEELWTII